MSDGMLTNVKGVNGGLGWLASTGRRHGGASLDHSIWFRLTIVALDFKSQRGSETMSRSSHHHHNLACSFRGSALDDIHRLRVFDTGE